MEPKADAAPGVYPVRIETPLGMSNILLFTLGTFPEVTEEESQPNSPPNRNDSIETAEPVRSTPVVVNGTLRGPERDVYRVSGKAGERRVFEVEARRCGSAIDPVLRILDGAGKQLARSDDSAGHGPRCASGFHLPEGRQLLRRSHRRAVQQSGAELLPAENGRVPLCRGHFPAGRPARRAGRRSRSSARGAAQACSPPWTCARQAREAFTRVALPDSPALPFVFAVSDLPEVMEPVEGADAHPGRGQRPPG